MTVPECSSISVVRLGALDVGAGAEWRRALSEAETVDGRERELARKVVNTDREKPATGISCLGPQLASERDKASGEYHDCRVDDVLVPSGDVASAATEQGDASVVLDLDVEQVALLRPFDLRKKLPPVETVGAESTAFRARLVVRLQVLPVAMRCWRVGPGRAPLRRRYVRWVTQSDG